MNKFFYIQTKEKQKEKLKSSIKMKKVKEENNKNSENNIYRADQPFIRGLN